jgi:hypothetical protein
MGNIDIGTKIWQNKGTVASVFPVADAFFKEYSPRCWLIPVIAPTTKNCDTKDPTAILDWAKFCYDKTDGEGSDSYVQGDITCGQRLQGTSEGLCFSNRLVREKAKGM